MRSAFAVRRIPGGGDLWISELVLTYDGQPFYVVRVMEFEDGEVVRETQHFGDPFEPGGPSGSTIWNDGPVAARPLRVNGHQGVSRL